MCHFFPVEDTLVAVSLAFETHHPLIHSELPAWMTVIHDNETCANFNSKKYAEAVLKPILRTARRLVDNRPILLLHDAAEYFNTPKYLQMATNLTCISPMVIPPIGSSRSKYFNATYRLGLSLNFMRQVTMVSRSMDQTLPHVQRLVEATIQVREYAMTPSVIRQSWVETKLLQTDGTFVR